MNQTKCENSDSQPILDACSNEPASRSYENLLTRSVAALTAVGRSNEEIARSLNVPSGMIDLVRSNPEYEEVLFANTIATDGTLEEKIQAVAPALLERKLHFALSSGDLKLANAAISELLDRGYGRPTQRIEAKSVNLNVLATGQEIQASIEASNAALARLEEMKTRLLNAD